MSDDDLQKVATLTHGLSGAEIENIINLAALQSVRRAVQSKAKNSKLEGKELVEFTNNHIEAQKAQMKAEQTNKILSAYTGFMNHNLYR